ncbi:probable permease of the major facilitator superfamily [Rhynchosporium agropyri]|uniref:Probable permease of the major facilitator superfamily n=1 Tax=Rhynchosporium agropyri TaxID=914238 RepID=A0A1E1LRF0_9HELO|nr:probable permease of the major facilitator superfamily [Rhynchosporium agropyri]
MGQPEKASKVLVAAPAERLVRTLQEKYADITLRLIEEHGDCFEPMSENAAKKVQRKLYWRIMFLVCCISLMLFIDKATLGASSILGLFEETGISLQQYNNLNMFFYVGYIAALWPGHYLLQRLPFGKQVSAIIFTWAVVVFLHCVATSYAPLVVVRMALGAVEAVIIPAIEMTIGMIFNREEQAFLQPVLWVTTSLAPVVTGFISYGLLFSSSPVRPWKLFMVTTGSLTFALAIWTWFCYPNNPAEASFLTLEEKVHVIKRVQKSSQSSIEQKQFKKEQFIETLKDPVSWLFTLQAFTLMYANNLTYGQQTPFVRSLGISVLGSTLVKAASGGFGVCVYITATILIKTFPGNAAYHGLLWCLPAIAGGIGMVTISWDQKLALLACMILAGGTYGVTYIVALGWTSSSAAGYTKKLTRNVMFMVGYCVGNLVSPQIWVPSARPRYYGAWISMVVVSWCGTPLILLAIRYILIRRNIEREALRAEAFDGHSDLGFATVDIEENGEIIQKRVAIEMLDLTDMENLEFIYPL